MSTRLNGTGHAPGPRLGPTDAVDLHLHTLASDGFWTPSDLIHHLAEKRITVAAVCDHDTQRSVVEAIRLGQERGVHVIPGVEVTTTWRNRQWHLLVYGIHPERRDPAATAFQAALAELDAILQNRAVDARRRIEASGRPLPSLGSILAGRPMWPFHVLSAAIQDKHVPNLKESAELVVALGGNFTADLPIESVVQAAHEAGGICVMAHPGRSDSVGIMTERDLDDMLRDTPLDGLEAHYRSYTDAQTALYREMATSRGLLISCGSDSHALGKPVDPRPWHAAWCRDLLARLGVAVDPSTGPDWLPGTDRLATAPVPPKAAAPATPPAPDSPAETAEPAETLAAVVPETVGAAS